MPEGPFGVPRITDLGPFSSHHRDDPSECSVKICYKGKSKEEAFRDNITAFLNNKEKLGRSLEDAGVPVREIVVGGSMTKGDFGCRDMNKIRDELIEISEVNEDLRAVIDELLSVSNPGEVVHKSEELLGEGSIPHEDVLIAVCSDMDVFVIGNENKFYGANRRREVNEATDEFINSVINESDTNLHPIINARDEIEGDVISTKEDMEKILNRYY